MVSFAEAAPSYAESDISVEALGAARSQWFAEWPVWTESGHWPRAFQL